MRQPRCSRHRQRLLAGNCGRAKPPGRGVFRRALLCPAPLREWAAAGSREAQPRPIRAAAAPLPHDLSHCAPRDSRTSAPRRPAPLRPVAEQSGPAGGRGLLGSSKMRAIAGMEPTLPAARRAPMWSSRLPPVGAAAAGPERESQARLGQHSARPVGRPPGSRLGARSATQRSAMASFQTGPVCRTMFWPRSSGSPPRRSSASTPTSVRSGCRLRAVSAAHLQSRR